LWITGGEYIRAWKGKTRAHVPWEREAVLNELIGRGISLPDLK